VVDAEGLEEGLVDGEGDGDGPPLEDLILYGVDVVRADRVPAGGCELTRLAERCGVGLYPPVGRLTVVGKDMELSIPFPCEKTKSSVIGQALVETTVELVPDEATGEARMLVRVSFPVGDLLDCR